MRRETCHSSTGVKGYVLIHQRHVGVEHQAVDIAVRATSCQQAGSYFYGDGPTKGRPIVGQTELSRRRRCGRDPCANRHTRTFLIVHCSLSEMERCCR